MTMSAIISGGITEKLGSHVCAISTMKREVSIYCKTLPKQYQLKHNSFISPFGSLLKQQVIFKRNLHLSIFLCNVLSLFLLAR